MVDIEEVVRPEVKRQIEIKLEEHMAAEDARFDQLLTDIKELKEEVRLFTNAWQQAKGVVTFVKWFVSICGGVATFFLFIKDHWR